MTVLVGVDRASFVTGLGMRLRAAGVPVALPALVAFSRALEVAFPEDVSDLYWTARLTLVHQPHDLAAFDEVFDAVFREAVLATDPHARRSARSVSSAGDQDARWTPVGGGAATEQGGEGLPWHTVPRTTPDDAGGDHAAPLPDLMPSAVVRFADTPLEDLDERQVAVLGAWLEQVVRRWPTRRSRRLEVRPHGNRVALRATLAASRRTGWEPLVLRRTRPVERPRPVTVLADLSQSMQPYAPALLQMMRALARSARAETFVFSTTLTRLTPALAHPSAVTAAERAGAAAADRFGGTHLATNLRELLSSRYGRVLRGGVLVVASDGWDSDPPEELGAAMARVRRRAHRVVWVNPRAAASGFEPLVGSMAAALPYCDAFLPGHTPRGLQEVLAAIGEISSPVRSPVRSPVSSRG